MVRNLPPYELHHLIHPGLSLALLAITVSATMAILAFLCAGSCHPKSPAEKRSSSSKRAPSSKQSSRTISKEKPDEAAAAAAATVVDAAEDDPQQPGSPSASDEKVVLDPDVATHGPIPPTVVPTDRSMRSPKRRLSMNLSVKLPEGLSMIKIKERHTKDAVDQETIWKKTIILGEKCRVPSDDEDDTGSAGGENGSRRKNYHPKTPRSLPISPREVPSSNPEVPSSNPEVP